MRPKEEGKGTPCRERAKPFCPNHGPTQGTRRKFKKMARDKGKVQESVGAEKAQEVSNKRKAFNDMLFISKGNVQKRLYVGEQVGSVIDFTEMAVTAEQHRLEK